MFYRSHYTYINFDYEGLVQTFQCLYFKSHIYTWMHCNVQTTTCMDRLLNHAAWKSSLTLFLLIQLLGDESRLVNLQVRHISGEKLRRRRQRKHRLRLQGQLFTVWERIGLGEVSARKALKKISRMLADF